MNAWTTREARANLEFGGVWFRSKAVPGWAFRLRRECPWNSAAQVALFRLSAEPHIADYLDRIRTPDYKRTDADTAIDQELALRAYIGGHIVEWAGVYGPDGKPMAFTEANAIQLFQHFPDVLAECREFAKDGARFEPRSADDLEALARGN